MRWCGGRQAVAGPSACGRGRVGGGRAAGGRAFSGLRPGGPPRLPAVALSGLRRRPTSARSVAGSPGRRPGSPRPPATGFPGRRPVDRLGRQPWSPDRRPRVFPGPSDGGSPGPPAGSSPRPSAVDSRPPTADRRPCRGRRPMGFPDRRPGAFLGRQPWVSPTADRGSCLGLRSRGPPPSAGVLPDLRPVGSLVGDRVRLGLLPWSPPVPRPQARHGLSPRAFPGRRSRVRLGFRWWVFRGLRPSASPPSGGGIPCGRVVGKRRREPTLLTAGPAGKSGLAGLQSRFRTARRGCGTAARSAVVYGWRGAWKISSAVPSSTIRPPFITATRWLSRRTTPRSWEMNT